MEEIIEETIEDLELFESFDDLVREDIKRCIKTLFKLAGKEKKEGERYRFLELLAKIQKTSDIKIELDSKDKQELLDDFKNQIQKLIEELKDIRSSLHDFDSALVTLEEANRALIELKYNPKESFFWSAPHSESNAEKARKFYKDFLRIEKKLYLLNHDILDKTITDIKSEHFRNQMSKFKNSFHISVERYKELIKDIDEKNKKQLKDLKHTYEFQTLNDESAKAISTILKRYMDFRKYIELGISVREKTISELTKTMDDLKSLNLNSKSKKTRFRVALERTKQKINARLKLRFRGNGMNILMLTIPNSIRSGVGSAVRLLSKDLDHQRINVFQLTHWWHKYYFFDRNGNYSKSEGTNRKGKYAKVTMSPFSILDAHSQPILFNMKWAGKHAADFLIEDIKFRPKIIHVQTHTFEFDRAFDVIKKKSGNPPVVYTLHAIIPYLRASEELKAKMILGNSPQEVKRFRESSYCSKRERGQESMIMKADKVICIADIHKVIFDNIYPEFKNKSVVIVNGTDIHKLITKNTESEMIKHRNKLAPSNEFLIGYIGRLEAKKIGKLPNAFSIIKKKIPNAKLVLIGAVYPKPKNEEEYIRKKEELLKKLKETYEMTKEAIDSVEIMPWIDEKSKMVSAIQSMNLVVMPMVSPGLYSLAALEAISLGVPTITSEGSLSIGKSDSEKAMVDSILYYYSKKDTPEIQELIKRSQQEVRERYSPERFVEDHIKLYKSLI